MKDSKKTWAILCLEKKWEKKVVFLVQLLFLCFLFFFGFFPFLVLSLQFCFLYRRPLSLLTSDNNTGNSSALILERCDSIFLSFLFREFMTFSLCLSLFLLFLFVVRGWSSCQKGYTSHYPTLALWGKRKKMKRRRRDSYFFSLSFFIFFSFFLFSFFFFFCDFPFEKLLVFFQPKELKECSS